MGWGEAIALLLGITGKLLDLHSKNQLTRENVVKTLNQAVAELKDPPPPKQ